MKIRHKKIVAQTTADYADILTDFKIFRPKELAIDTETTGLDVINDKPFIIQIGFRAGSNMQSYILDPKAKLTKTILEHLWHICRQHNIKVIGHNLKFDLHMLLNVGIEIPTKNLSDTMFNIRFAHDSLSVENGGPPLELKEYAAQYISKEAKQHDKLIQTARTGIAKDYNQTLITTFKKAQAQPDKKSWTIGLLAEMFKDTFDNLTVLPKELQELYKIWKKTLPEKIQENMTEFFVESKNIPYDLIDKKILYEYAHADILYTLLIHASTMSVIKNRHQEFAYELECDLIIPLLEMERVGFKIDKKYLEDSKINMEQYIIERRKALSKLLGEDIRVNQHQKIKELINKKYNVKLLSTESKYVRSILPYETNKDVKVVLNVIQELRTLEKWYNTYLLRFYKQAQHTNRIYTTINQVGAVTGRVTSDFQQFPRKGITKIDGTPLFNPRQLVITSKTYLAYIDYSQIELRLQAEYTILVGNPDINLCRAYTPWECYEKNGVWYHKEDDTEWHPTDVHSLTTSMAYPEVPIDSARFKRLRADVGKPANFAKNYGGTIRVIREMFPDKSEDELQKIDQAYYKAFPGIKTYQEYCYAMARASTFTTNLFGVKYYGLTGHKLINCLIQGSAATLLKLKIIEIHKFLKLNNYKTRFQMNIHDELSFEVPKGELKILFKLKDIMENVKGLRIPLIAGIETSKTSWADKEMYNG